MRPRAWALVLAACLLMGQGQAQERTLDLDQAFTLAERHNAELEAARRAVTSARTGLTIAGARPNPNFIAQYPFNGLAETIHQVGLEQPIEMGGRRGARLAVAQDQVRQAELQERTIFWQIRSQVRQAYMDLGMARATRDQLQAGVAVADELLQAAEKRFKAGDVAEADVIRARFERELARQRLVTAGNQITQANLRLDALIGASPGTPMAVAAVPQPELAAPLDQLREWAHMHRAELASAQQDLQLAHNKVKLAQANQSPNFTVTGSYNWDPMVTPSWMLGVSLELPWVPWGYDRQGEVDQARADVSTFEARLLVQERAVDTEVAAAYADYQANREALERDRTVLLPQADEVLNLAHKLYEYGQGDLTQVLVAQKTVLSQREAMLADLAACQTALGNLEKAVGMPLK